MDYAWLSQTKEKEDFQKDIVKDLLAKITDLEQKVVTDVRTDTFSKQPGYGREDTLSDARSGTGLDRQSSVASFRPSVARDVLKKLKKGGNRKRF